MLTKWRLNVSSTKYNAVLSRAWSSATNSTQNANTNCKFEDKFEDAKPYESIPGPRPLPVVGNLWRHFIGEFRATDFVVFHEKLHKKYGDICGFRKQPPVSDLLYLFNPTDIEKLIRNEGLHPIREGFYSMKYYRSVMRSDIFAEAPGLISTHGEEWYNFRTKINKAFLQPRNAKQFIAPMDSVAGQFVELMKQLAEQNESSEMPANFVNFLNRWSMEVTGELAVGKKMGCLSIHPNKEAQAMIDNMKEFFSLVNIMDFSPLGPYIQRWNLPMWKRYVKHVEFITNYIIAIVDEAEQKSKSQPRHEGLSEEGLSMFERLLKIDRNTAIVGALEMIHAGVDTTARVAGSTLYFVSKYPKVQDRIRGELMLQMPTPDTPVTEEVLNNLPYLKATIREVQRLVPIGTAHMRRTVTDLTLNGYHVPAGVNVIIPTLYLSTRDKYYPRAKEFIPERWLKTTTDEMSYKNTNSFISLPFGYGPRSCLGQRFAQLEIEVLVSKILRNFHLDWPHPDMKFLLGLLTDMEDPLKLRLKPITQ